MEAPGQSQTDPTGRNIWATTPIGRVAAPVREQVLAVVRQAILDHSLQPGQRLIERELIEQLGVSRPTIREVVGRLATEGLVTMIPQRGAIVSVLSEDDAADIYEMRAPLEALAAQRFVERAADAQVKELRAAFESLEKLVAAHDIDQVKANDAICEILLEGAASPPLTQTLVSLQGRVRMLRSTSLSMPGRPEQMVQEIRVIVEAIERRDSDLAAAASATHVRNAARAAMRQLARSQTENAGVVEQKRRT